MHTRAGARRATRLAQRAKPAPTIHSIFLLQIQWWTRFALYRMVQGFALSTLLLSFIH